MKRREFIAGLGSAAAWPVVARAQQPALPVIGLVAGGRSADGDIFSENMTAFRKGLGETGYVEGQNVVIEYRYAENRYDRLPALMTDLVRRRVTVIVTPATTLVAIAAKAATTTIPIVFGVNEDQSS
jgi:putative ABC transport system substrate-binding protein